MGKVGDWFGPDVAIRVEKFLAFFVEIEEILDGGESDVAGVERELCDGKDLVLEITVERKKKKV
jgi:hypothetical protein